MLRSHESDAKELHRKIRTQVDDLKTLHKKCKELEKELQVTQDQNERLHRENGQLKAEKEKIAGVGEAQIAELSTKLEQQRSSVNPTSGKPDGRSLAKEERERWEHNKRQQKIIDSLRAKEKTLLEKLEEAAKLIEARNRTIERVEREKTRVERENTTLSKKVKQRETLRSENPNLLRKDNQGASGGPTQRGTSMPSRGAQHSGGPDYAPIDPQVEAELSRSLMQREGEIRVLQLENEQLQRQLEELQINSPVDPDASREWAAKADAEARQRLETANENMLLAFDLEQVKAQLAEVRKSTGTGRPRPPSDDKGISNMQ